MAKLRSASWQWGGQKYAARCSLLWKTGTDGSQCHLESATLKASIMFLLMGLQKWLLHGLDATCEEPPKQLVCPCPCVSVTSLSIPFLPCRRCGQ